MGANIDYAIVISGRFMELKDKMPKKDAIIETMNFAFPTIVTSGSMLALAGILLDRCLRTARFVESGNVWGAVPSVPLSSLCLYCRRFCCLVKKL